MIKVDATTVQNKPDIQLTLSWEAASVLRSIIQCTNMDVVDNHSLETSDDVYKVAMQIEACLNGIISPVVARK